MPLGWYLGLISIFLAFVACIYCAWRLYTRGVTVRETFGVFLCAAFVCGIAEIAVEYM